MFQHTRDRVVGLVLLAVSIAGCGDTTAKKAVSPPGKGVVLKGAGATFPEPLYKSWFQIFHQNHPDVAVEYAGIGSGGGIKRFIGKSPELKPSDSVDFGASDAAMSDAEIAQVERGVQLIPTTAGALVLAYNLPGYDGELKLSRAAYAGIFLGRISRWNDPLIVKDNPPLADSKMTIALAVRRDSSGTTFAFTSHLSAISSEWRDRFGAVQLLAWPGVSLPAHGNERVAATIQLSVGSIGYVHLGFAQRIGLPMATLENKAGKFVRPTKSNATAALASAPLPPNLRVFIPDPDGEDAYPIVTLTWIALYRSYPEAKKREAISKLLSWCLSEGQAQAEQLDYIRLPPKILSAATLAVAEIDR